MEKIMIRDTSTPFPPSVLRHAVLAFFVCAWWSASAGAAKPVAAIPPAPKEVVDDIVVAPVVIDGATLFRVRGVSAFPAESRAETIAARIRQLAADRSVSPDALTVTEIEPGSRIGVGDRLVLVVLSEDAQLEQLDRKTLAGVYVKRIGEAIESYRRERSPKSLGHGALLALAATGVLILVLWLGARLVRLTDGVLERRIKERLGLIEAHSLRIVRAANLWRVLRALRNLLWTAAVLIAVVFYLNYILQLFPWTRWLGKRLLDLLVAPLRAAGEGLLVLIPDLLFLAILVVVTRYALQALRLLFTGVAEGRVSLANFDREWAWPTYRLVRLLVLVFAIVVAYPYIPGSSSDAFKGISVFLGVIFSLGSSSLIGNVIAGYSMTYRRAFRLGDRVRINEHVGDVAIQRLLVTHLHTPKNEEIIIPNSEILGGSVVNYSTLAREGKLILHTTVGIGYETPWRQVEAMLLQAAERTEGLLKEPKPFVMQKALGDFAVTYEINAYCNDAQAMNRLYTKLHQNILDVFNEYGVQIMTPAYEGDPEQPKIVPKDRWFVAPAGGQR
jgi:small-conductance mechanosensitive channel